MHTIYNLHNFIDELPDEIKSEWLELGVKRTFADQESIYLQGDESTDLYQISSGEVRFSNYSEDGKEMVLTTLKTGDCFGEIGLIDSLPRSSNAIAIGETKLKLLSKSKFYYLYNKYPEVAKQINVMLVHRLRLVWQLSEEASTLSLHQRLARTLMRLSYSHGKKESNGVYSIGTSQEDLGRMLGASRQSVSKELKALESEGCIEVKYGQTLIVDPVTLNAHYENLIGQQQLMPVYKKR